VIVGNNHCVCRHASSLHTLPKDNNRQAVPALNEPMLMQQVITAGGAFMATNVDDIVVLTLLFSRLPHRGRALPLMVGQVLGFSLLGVFGRQTLPHGSLALLGLLPIALGVRRWQQAGGIAIAPPPAVDDSPSGSGLTGAGPLAEGLGMAGLTLANGSDNIGVYLPLFAQADRATVTVTLVTFAAALALWMALAWSLTRAPALAPLLQRYGSALVPAVLIGLGLLILVTTPGG
jgi:cadmium resistance protein CadD (predicted permease)